MYSLNLHNASLQTWVAQREGVDSICCACLHPARTCLALARGSTLVISPLLGGDAAYAQPQTLRQHVLEQQITALAWFVHLAPSSSHPLTSPPAAPAASPSSAPETHRPPSVGVEPGTSASSTTPEPGGSSASSSSSRVLSLADHQVLLTGTADGFLQLHDVEGQLLFKQRLHTSAVCDIQIRTCGSGVAGPSPSEDVTVTFADAVARITVLDLRAQVALLQLARQSPSSSAAASLRPLPVQRWELPPRHGPRSTGVCCGVMPPDLYALLVAAGRNKQPPSKLCVVTGGQAPFLASYEADEQAGRSTLGLLADYASSLTSGVLSAASSMAAAGPNLLKAGVRQLLLNPVLGSWAGSAQRPLPPVAFEDVKQLPPAEVAGPWRAVRDEPRQADLVSLAPCGPLAAVTDNMGRVLLLDVAQMVLVRMWKGYRDAQCGWAQPPPGHHWAHHKLLLVLYAPKRQILEVWVPGDSKRVAAVNVAGSCVLLPASPPCGGWRNEAAGVWDSKYPASTLVLQLHDGQAWDVLQCMQTAAEAS